MNAVVTGSNDDRSADERRDWLQVVVIGARAESAKISDDHNALPRTTSYRLNPLYFNLNIP